MCNEKKLKQFDKDELKELKDLTDKVEACHKEFEENHPGQHDKECEKCRPMLKRLQELVDRQKQDC